MPASNYLNNKLLDHTFRNTAWTSPTTVYVQMHIGDPGGDCVNNGAAETTRKAVTFAAAAANSISATGTPVASWTAVAATETWTDFSVWDASTAGNPLGYGDMAPTVPVASGGDAELTALTFTHS